MNKKLTCIGIFAILAVLYVGKAAAYEVGGDVATATATVSGVTVSTSAATRMDASVISGYSRYGARIQNQDSTYSIWCGYSSGVTVSGSTVGVKIVPGASAPFPVGRQITIYCIAESGAGASGVLASVENLGY